MLIGIDEGVSQVFAHISSDSSSLGGNRPGVSSEPEIAGVGSGGYFRSLLAFIL